ncbi:MAG TPA: pyrroloquinoline quinone-dependent dehydrogenase [Vicinamibacterales bacterium]|nr:pyrroloquinoline quinone-dependent dehydrogenase [Vicinamibacterales bacterium]
MSVLASGLGCAILVFQMHGTTIAVLHSQQPTNSADWPIYGGSPGGMRYSSLAQINQGNVQALREVWSVDAGDGSGSLETNPIVINGVLYGYTLAQKIFAVNAATGNEIWTFDAGIIGRGNNRGLSYWSSGSDERIFAPVQRYLYALDARTGRPDPGFGNNGRIDVQADLRGGPDGISAAIGHAVVVYKDLVIFAGRTGEALPAAPGDVRAYDARNGRLRWTFHTLPHPGEYGYETWPKDAWTYTGNLASWAGMSLDERRGIVYVPVANPANMFIGRDRLGDNLFANSVLALNAETGARIWHFQTVKHDLWDRDLPAPPTLVTVKRDGRTIDAVAQTTKTGHLYLFERATGTALFPIDYRKYPDSAIPGEVVAETQPLPTKPEPFARQRLTEDMLTTRTPQAHAAALAQFRRMVSGGQFVPPSVGKDTISFPGMDGGAEWGGPAFDPETGLLYVNSNEMVWLYALAESPARGTAVSGKQLYVDHCATCHREDRTGAPPAIPSLVGVGDRMTPPDVRSVIFYGGNRMPSFATTASEYINAIVQYVTKGDESMIGIPATTTPVPYDAQYRFTGHHKFLDPDGYPAIAPPWGTLNAIDLNTGEYAWRIPLGEYPELAAQGMKNTGSENYGGPIVTAGGLVFIAATNFDRKFRAFDKKSGKLLWETTLPFPGNATPATYEIDGRQYIVIASSGAGVLHNQRNTRGAQPGGAKYVAFALPSASKQSAIARSLTY